MKTALVLFAVGALAQSKKQLHQKQPRIVGGVAGNIKDYPFLVRLNVDGFVCGGSLISNRWVLTAAHCISEDDGSTMPSSTRVSVVTGGNDFDPPLTLEVEKWVAHPNYDHVDIADDVALIQLKRQTPYAAQMDYELQFIKFQATPLPEGATFRAIGWGYVAPDTFADKLMEVDVHSSNVEYCDRVRQDSADPPAVPKTICAGGSAQDLGKDSCAGDSGGPLVYRKSDDSPWVQAGIVNYGIPGPDYQGSAESAECGELDYWGVYGTPSQYVDWIESVTGISAESLLYKSLEECAADLAAGGKPCNCGAVTCASVLLAESNLSSCASTCESSYAECLTDACAIDTSSSSANILLAVSSSLLTLLALF